MSPSPLRVSEGLTLTLTQTEGIAGLVPCRGRTRLFPQTPHFITSSYTVKEIIFNSLYSAVAQHRVCSTNDYITDDFFELEVSGISSRSCNMSLFLQQSYSSNVCSSTAVDCLA
jgi:hypothetical protein